MSFKAKIAAGAATFALVSGGLGLAGTLSASAATPSCGSCSDFHSLKFNQGHRPSFVLDTLHGTAAQNQEIIQFQASNSDPAEDFKITYEGHVSDYYNVALDGGYFSNPFENHYGSESLYQFEYEPYGNSSDLCAGTWVGEQATAGFKVRLEPCGAVNTLWVKDTKDSSGSASHYNAYINGTSQAFSDPLVLNYPAGYPTDTPRPWLNVQPLQHYSDNTVYDNQLWAHTGGS